MLVTVEWQSQTLLTTKLSLILFQRLKKFITIFVSPCSPLQGFVQVFWVRVVSPLFAFTRVCLQLHESLSALFAFLTFCSGLLGLLCLASVRLRCVLLWLAECELSLALLAFITFRLCRLGESCCTSLRLHDVLHKPAG